MEQLNRCWVVVSISYTQLLIALRQSWKLCLNLCSQTWLKPRSNLVISLIPFYYCCQIYYKMGRISYKILLFLKILIPSGLCFDPDYSILVDQKKERIFEKFVLHRRLQLSSGTYSKKIIWNFVFKELKKKKTSPKPTPMPKRIMS